MNRIYLYRAFSNSEYPFVRPASFRSQRQEIDPVTGDKRNGMTENLPTLSAKMTFPMKFINIL
jgi:hypothetical protein